MQKIIIDLVNGTCNTLEAHLLVKQFRASLQTFSFCSCFYVSQTSMLGWYNNLGFDMDGNCNSLTPQKRSNDGGSDSRRDYKLKILLPNGTTVSVEISQVTQFINVNELVNKVKQQAEMTSDPNKSVNWDADLCFIDDYDYVFRNCLRLDDGSPPAMIYYKDIWDLTPDLDLLIELPAEYTFEAALADLIDNSLQAVWANDESDRRLIRYQGQHIGNLCLSVEVSSEKNLYLTQVRVWTVCL